jgi:hypothetical protein
VTALLLLVLLPVQLGCMRVRYDQAMAYTIQEYGGKLPFVSK